MSRREWEFFRLDREGLEENLVLTAQNAPREGLLDKDLRENGGQVMNSSVMLMKNQAATAA
jgi:hypothetical protein